MQNVLNDKQRERYAEFTAFVSKHVEPHARDWDRNQRVPAAAISSIAAAGYLGCTLPEKFGGMACDCVTFGLLNEAFGRGMSSLTDLLTVQAMVSMTLLRWGTDQQKERWLRSLAKGEVIGAFALTEPGAGSDLTNLKTEFTQRDGVLTVNGVKRWISFGQNADVFLVFGKLENAPLACLVERHAPGVQVTPIDDLMGFRAAGLAQIDFHQVEVSPDNVVGKPGFGFSHIAPIGLHYGRISTACSALGLLRACFEESVSRAATRELAQGKVGNLGVIQSMIAKMGTELEAGRLLCLSACAAEDDREPDAFAKALMAKFFVSKAVVRAASDAVQIHGASGCHEASPVARYYRDAKVMEIIEGTTQVHEQLLGRSFIEAAPKRVTT